MWKKPPINPVGSLKHTDSEKLDEWVDENYESYERSYWGPLIRKTQANFAIPFDPETNEDFLFIGQIGVDIFDLCDFSYYLFYNPDKKIVAQLMQMT